MTEFTMPEVDVDDLDEQMPELIAELLTGAGAIALRQAFPADEIDEAAASLGARVFSIEAVIHLAQSLDGK